MFTCCMLSKEMESEKQTWVQFHPLRTSQPLWRKPRGKQRDDIIVTALTKQLIEPRGSSRRETLCCGTPIFTMGLDSTPRIQLCKWSLPSKRSVFVQRQQYGAPCFGVCHTCHFQHGREDLNQTRTTYMTYFML